MKKIYHIVKLLRPKQWFKNIFIFPAIIFSKQFLIESKGNYQLNFDNLIKVLLLFIVFCLVSSCVYVMNDIMDVSEDRLHPKKRNRPIANGDISIKGGIVIFIILFVMSVSLSFLFKLDIQIVLLIYFVINILYSIWLKKVPVIDIMMVASGFLLRAIAGAFVINVVITNWFLVCIFMISLMIASIKRRGEISIKSEHRRSVLKLYNAEILDLFVALSSISSLITYCIFALNYKIKYFYITIPVVIYWMMRYLYVSYRNREQSESPDEVLISDIHIIITSILYFVAVGISMFVLG